MTATYDIPETGYYVNMGRWASHVIGPFDDRETAEEYINTLDWCGGAPTVVTIEPPLAWKLDEITQVQLTLTRAVFDAVRDIVGDDNKHPQRFVAHDALINAAVRDAEATF